MKKALVVFTVASTMFLLATNGFALTYGFYDITNNSATDAAIGASQLSVDVTDTGSNHVLFSFANSGPLACVIAEVYFDDNNLLNNLGIINSSGVLFQQYATPSALPGGNSISPQFLVTSGLSADANNPKPVWGVDPGENLGISFSLHDGQTFQNVIDSMNSGDLRLGLHVQAFADGFSDSFLNNRNNTPPVPEPATMLLVGSGMLCLAGFRKRVSK